MFYSRNVKYGKGVKKGREGESQKLSVRMKGTLVCRTCLC